MATREDRALRRAAASGAGPTAADPARNPGAVGAFALFGEVVLTGLLVTAAALPILTAPAALAAGHRHLRRYVRAEGSSLAQAWRDFVRALPGGLLVGLAAAAAAAALVLDIVLAGAGALPGGALVVGAGWTVAALLGAALLIAASHWSAEGGWRAALRAVPGAVGADPLGTLYIACAGGFVMLATWMLVPLIAPALGCAVLATVAVPARARRR
jgi:hypothetical protein